MQKASTLKRIIAIAALTLVYGLALAIGTFPKFRKRKKNNRIIITGTFHNPNWFFAHVAPITESNYGEVILICDEVIAELPNLRYLCPPKWANKIFSRAGAKAIWTFYAGIKYPTDLFMGYHIFPAAIISLICGRILGARTAYQITAGPLELEGGGWHAENKLLVALHKPSAWIEKLALNITKQFDLVIVRGEHAKTFVLNAGYNNLLETITGSVEIKQSLIQPNKPIDIMLVGRLSEYKRPDRFLKVIHRVKDKSPNVKAKIVGDGPDRKTLEKMADELNIRDNIEFMGQRKDVPELLGQVKIFVLTSRWEGVSIAMLEAMGLGAVPVVSDVGDLGDFVKNGVTGYIIPEDDIDTFAKRILYLLENEAERSNQSETAKKWIEARCERQQVSHQWKETLVKTTS